MKTGITVKSLSLSHKNYLEKIEKKTDQFSSQLMSNTKWLKVFQLLSDHKAIVAKCNIISIWDDRPRQLDIPDAIGFNDTFYNEGIKDVTIGGPLLFKEIERLEFPAYWETQRQMRSEKLTPLKHTQDINRIRELLMTIGVLEIEQDDEGLIVFGYK